MTKQILSQFEIEGGIGETSISITPDMNIKLKTIENDIFNSSDIQVKVDLIRRRILQLIIIKMSLQLIIITYQMLFMLLLNMVLLLLNQTYQAKL